MVRKIPSRGHFEGQLPRIRIGSWTKMDYLGQKRYFFSFFQNQSKVIGHSFCNFAADLADGARFCLAWCAQSAEPLNQIGMHQSMKLQKKSGRLEEK